MKKAIEERREEKKEEEMLNIKDKVRQKLGEKMK